MSGDHSAQSCGKRIKSGVIGFDEVLNGGFVDRRGYLIRGGPGTGKTTLGMHFLREGAENGEATLYITLGESEQNLKDNARRIGIESSGIHFLDLSPESDFFAGAKSYDLFAAAEVERDPLTKKIVSAVENVKPRRVFLDSTSHLRYLAIDAFQFRKQLLSFIRFLLETGSIVLFTSEGTKSIPDDDVMYLSDGIITLALEERMRTLEITKFRGSNFAIGKHTLKLGDQGAEVFPKLVPDRHLRPFAPTLIRSGVGEIDKLLHGGLEQGTVTLITGPAGVGKTTLTMQFASQAASLGHHTAILTFEESLDSLTHRTESVKIPLKQMLASGRLKAIPIEPLLYSADQISALVRREVEEHGATCIILDGMTGYRISVVGDIQLQLRGLFKYLTNMGVSVLAVNETENITGEFKATEIGISYMADNIIFLRYLELRGEMRKAIGVLKKRLGDFERQLREFAITGEGVKVGLPLSSLRGILQGVPEWVEARDTDDAGQPT